MALAAYATIAARVPLDGDEPHYLIISDSLLTDRDLRRRTTTSVTATSAIYGPIPPHAYRIPEGGRFLPGGGRPRRRPPALVALPFAVDGARARRSPRSVHRSHAVRVRLWLASISGQRIAA
jgi:hypothetical protein